MDESVVDPNYEYEAPQFYDFYNGPADEDDHVDSWFDGKPDDEGGVEIPEDFQPEDKEEENEALQENSKHKAVDTAKVVLFADDEACENEDIKYEEKPIDEEAKRQEPEEAYEVSTSEVNHNVVSNGCECEDESKQRENINEPNEPEAESKEAKTENKEPIGTQEARPSKILTSWEDWNRGKPKDCQSVTEVNGHKATGKPALYKKQTDEPKRITRNQKRNNVLNASASSGIPSKKQKGTQEHSGDSGSSSESGKTKRSRSLCSNPEKKLPTVTIPVTPQCLKRQKTAKPVMIKLKTSEEMEMERIAKLRRKTKNHIKANENSMKKAISCTSYHPVRTNTEPTQPQEFHFETDKRVKPHPMTTRADDAEKEFLNSLRQHPPSPTWKHRSVTVPKPFNLSGGGHSTKRKHSAMEKDNQDTDSYETMAYQVYKFQTTTPPRFRTKKANEPKTEPEQSAAKKPTPKVTCPKTPSLSTKSRARPVAADILSKEEQEEKEVAAMKSYQFKARPFDRRIVEGEGLFGVKRSNKQKELTQIVPFAFESDERLEARKQENTTECQEEENVVPFKALPQPNFDKVFRPQLKHESTAPQPFSFEEKDKERWQKKDSKIQEVYKEEEKLREFKAQPLPPDSPETLPAISSKTTTSFRPFALNTENRGAAKAEKWIQKVKSELHEERSKTVFKANPSKVIHEAPFVPQKSQKALTEVSEFALNTIRRAERREEIDTIKKEREQIDEELRKEREAEREKEEKEAIALLRKQLVHKAQPIHKYKKVIVKPSEKPLTAALSPAWSDIKRRRVENFR